MATSIQWGLVGFSFVLQSTEVIKGRDRQVIHKGKGSDNFFFSEKKKMSGEEKGMCAWIQRKSEIKMNLSLDLVTKK